MHAAQARAGNAAVTDALEDRELGPATVGRQWDDRGVEQAPHPANQRLPIEVQHPRFDLRIAGGSFDRIVAGRRVRSARGFSEAMAGRQGTARVRVTAATGKSRLDPAARYIIDRRQASLRGQLPAFNGLQLSRRPRSELPPDQRGRTIADLRGVRAARGTVNGRARVRVGQVDLTSVHLPVEIALDGDGGIRLAYRFRGWSLELVGRQPRSGPGPLLDWTYVLRLPTARLAEGVWRDLPRRRRLGGVPPPAAVGAGAADPPEGDAEDPPADGDGDDERRSGR